MKTIPRSTVSSPVHTPLVLSDDGTLIKLESQQISGSVKYRMVHRKVVDALERGDLGVGKTLIEMTAGTTGVALAHVGEQLGMSVEIHAYDSIDPEKLRKIQALGARVVLYHKSQPIQEIFAKIQGAVSDGWAWHLNQLDRDSIVNSYRPLADEIIHQTRELALPTPEVFVCPVGTGGVIQGVGSRLRQVFPDIQVFAVEPASGSTLDGCRNTTDLHMGDKDSYDRDFPDKTFYVESPVRGLKTGEHTLGESASSVLHLAKSMVDGSRCLIVGAD